MASTAIPGLFPAVKIDSDYFGDGAVRQLKPISPALHMGATKLLIVGVSDNATRSKLPAWAGALPLNRTDCRAYV